MRNLVGKAGEAGADVVCQEHTAALSRGRTPALAPRIRCTVPRPRLRVERAFWVPLMAVRKRAYACSQSFCGGGTGLQLPSGSAEGVRWRWPAPAQCASHGSRRTPKARQNRKHGRHGDVALPASEEMGEILRFVRHAAADSRRPRGRIWSAGPVVDGSNSQKFVPMVKHLRAGRQCRTIPYTFFCPFAALPCTGDSFIKVKRTVWPLDKCAFRHNSEEKAVQASKNEEK